MKSRGLAVIAAFLLIALAIFIRGKVVDDGPSTSSDANGDTNGLPIVACTPDLADVCAALADAGTIAADPPLLDLSQATDPDESIDAWLTWNPAPQIANFSVAPDKVWQPPVVLGSAVEAVLIDQSSAQELPDACRTKPTWVCLGAATPDLSIGVGDPASAEGIARLAPLAQALSIDDDYTTLDINALDDLIASPPGRQADASEMASRLTTQPGSLSMTTGPNDALLAQTRTPQGNQRGLRVLSPDPASRLTVVVSERVGRRAPIVDQACEDSSDAFVASLEDLGLQPCEGIADAALAGFLFQVQKKVG